MKVVLIIAIQCWLASAQDYCLPTQACWPSRVEVAAFKQEMAQTGKAGVRTPDDKDWPGKFLTFNQAVAKVPGLVVYVGDADTVRKALTFAKKFNIKIRIVSSGHSFLGRCGDEGAMQISVHYMKGIEVNLKCKENSLGCITTQAGVQWGEAYREASDYNRLVVGGSNPTVSVSGWTVGGGHSPLTRSFGLGVDNVISYHLVTADLNEVWASNTSTSILYPNGTKTVGTDNSLFWALSGGGSAFGVLLDLTFKLHMDSSITQFVCTYPAYTDGTGKTFKVMYESFGTLFHDAPNTYSGYILPSIGCDPASKQCGGSSTVSIIHYGPITDTAFMKRFTDLPHTWAAAGLPQGDCQINNYSTFYEYELSIPNNTYGTEYIGGSLVQKNLASQSFTDTLLRHFDTAYKKALANPTYNLLTTAVWVGGAATEVPIDRVPVHKGWRNALFTITAATAWDQNVYPNGPADAIQGVRDFHKDLSTFSDGKYYNEAEYDMQPAEWKKEFWGDSLYAKLMAVKRAWDPQNIFSCNQCLGSDWNPASPDTVIG